MNIQILSDIHNEFGILDVPVTDNESETILVLAGDIGVAKHQKTYVPFITALAERFKYIVYVCGNHEHWNGQFTKTVSIIVKNLHHLSNVHVLEKSDIVLDDVVFIGATMWTDMNKKDPLCMYFSELKMNDYTKIRIGPKDKPWLRKLTPIDTIRDHIKAVEFIFEHIDFHKKSGKKVVVVTHHAPCSISLAPEFRIDDLAGAYHTKLTERIMNLDKNQPELWIHGHVHDSSDYNILNTRIICNPRGYHSLSINNNFNSKLRISI